MIVIYGTRNSGRVDHRAGQHAVTRFAHIYWLPLFPIASTWMTRPGFGHPMKMSGRSVLAGYARPWGVIFGGFGLLGLWGVPGIVAGLAGLAAAGASWVWNDVRGVTAQRRSDLNALAYGTRCEPKLLPDNIAEGLEIQAKHRWAQLSQGQSPSDVARFGTDDVNRAAAAYGVLRLSARSMPRAQAAEAEREATRIAEGIREQLQLDPGGPYRSAAPDQLQLEAPTKR